MSDKIKLLTDEGIEEIELYIGYFDNGISLDQPLKQEDIIDWLRRAVATVRELRNKEAKNLIVLGNANHKMDELEIRAEKAEALYQTVATKAMRYQQERIEALDNLEKVQARVKELEEKLKKKQNEIDQLMYN